MSRPSTAPAVAGIPIVLGVLLAPALDNTPPPAAGDANLHRGKVSFAQDAPSSYLQLSLADRALLSNPTTHQLPSFEDRKAITTLLKTDLGLEDGASLCVAGKKRREGPLLLIEVETLC